MKTNSMPVNVVEYRVPRRFMILRRCGSALMVSETDVLY